MVLKRKAADEGEDAGGLPHGGADPCRLDRLAFAIYGVSCLIAGREDDEAVRVRCGDGKSTRLAVRELRAALDLAQRRIDEAESGGERRRSPRSPVARYRRPDSPEELATLIRAFLQVEFGMDARSYPEEGPTPAFRVDVDLNSEGEIREASLAVWPGLGYEEGRGCGRVLTEDERSLIDAWRSGASEAESPATAGEGVPR